jgi:hypothetical protein
LTERGGRGSFVKLRHGHRDRRYSKPFPRQLRSGAGNDFTDRHNSNTEIENQLLHASSSYLFFRLLENVFGKMSTQQRPIAATPAVQRGSNGKLKL